VLEAAGLPVVAMVRAHELLAMMPAELPAA
jgi:hypothetical protein